MIAGSVTALTVPPPLTWSLVRGATCRGSELLHAAEKGIESSTSAGKYVPSSYLLPWSWSVRDDAYMHPTQKPELVYCLSSDSQSLSRTVAGGILHMVYPVLSTGPPGRSRETLAADRAVRVWPRARCP